MDVLLVYIVIWFLASYRLTKLFVYDDGPFYIFVRWRTYWIRKAETSSNQYSINNFMAELFTCDYCFSIYAVIAVLLLPNIVVLWLAVSGLFFIVETYFRNNQG